MILRLFLFAPFLASGLAATTSSGDDVPPLCEIVRPPNLICGASGLLTTPLLAAPVKKTLLLIDCLYSCYSLDTCVSFSWDLGSMKCSLYTQSLRHQGFKRSKPNDSRFYNIRCWRCTVPSASGELVINGNFEHVTKGWNSDGSFGGRIESPGHNSKYAFHVHAEKGDGYFQSSGEIGQVITLACKPYYLFSWQYSMSHPSPYAHVESLDTSISLAVTGPGIWKTSTVVVKPNGASTRLDGMAADCPNYFNSVAFSISSFANARGAVPNDILIDNVSLRPVNLSATPPPGSPNLIENGNAENKASPWNVTQCPDCGTLSIIPYSKVPKPGSADLSRYGSYVYRANLAHQPLNGPLDFPSAECTFSYSILNLEPGATYQFSMDFYSLQEMYFTYSIVPDDVVHKETREYSASFFEDNSDYPGIRWQSYERAFVNQEDITTAELKIDLRADGIPPPQKIILYFDNVRLVKISS